MSDGDMLPVPPVVIRNSTNKKGGITRPCHNKSPSLKPPAKDFRMPEHRPGSSVVSEPDENMPAVSR